MMQIKGLAGAAGCVAGHAAVFRPSELCLERRTVSDPQAEIDAMEAARARYNETLRRLAGEAWAAQGKEGTAIFEAYQVIAEDDYLFVPPMVPIQFPSGRISIFVPVSLGAEPLRMMMVASTFFAFVS